MFDPQLAAEVGKVLSLMSTQPGQRNTPADGDLEGAFDVWFDGGAVKHDTGVSQFRFVDGVAAVTGTSLQFSVVLRLPDGRIVEIRERDRDGLHPGALVGLE
jgi:hypothetical protein